VGVLIPWPSFNERLAFGPYQLPFLLPIPTYGVNWGNFKNIADFHMNDADEGEDPKEVVGRFPPTVNGWGETFYPTVDAEGALPTASLCFRGETSSTSSASQRTCVSAGQATFGPESWNGRTGAVVSAIIMDECHVKTDVDGKGGEGVNCNVCHEGLDSGNAVLNGPGGQLQGKVAYVRR